MRRGGQPGCGQTGRWEEGLTRWRRRVNTGHCSHIRSQCHPQMTAESGRPSPPSGHRPTVSVSEVCRQQDREHASEADGASGAASPSAQFKTSAHSRHLHGFLHGDCAAGSFTSLFSQQGEGLLFKTCFLVTRCILLTLFTVKIPNPELVPVSESLNVY